jgi:hypothetical protein
MTDTSIEALLDAAFRALLHDTEIPDVEHQSRRKFLRADFKRILAAANAAPAVSQQETLPRIGEEWQGGIYAGIARGVDGSQDYHLLLLSDEMESIAWEQAKDWAKDIGGELPINPEQALLYANLKGQFQPKIYWSGEARTTEFGGALIQDFDDGYQGYTSTFNKLRARAVRRIPIAAPLQAAQPEGFVPIPKIASDEWVDAVVRIDQPWLAKDCKAWGELRHEVARWHEAMIAAPGQADGGKG